MNIFFNGQEIDNGLLVFSEVPNLVEISQAVYGTKGQLKIVLSNAFSEAVTANSQYYVTLFEETITNVLAPTEATNRRFYVFPQAEGNAARNTALSMAKAFRSCSSLAAQFVITTATTNTEGDTILFTAKTIGKRNFLQSFDTNIQSYVTFTVIDDGSSDSSSSLLEYNDGFYKSKIDVEVYNADEYVTTLEKNWYGNRCVFDVTPVLATMTEPTNVFGNERLSKYVFKVNRLAENGNYTSLGEISGYTTYGYLANNSEKYLPLGLQVLSNTKVGDKAELIYTYDPYIVYSVLVRAGTSSTSFTASYTVYNQAMEELYSTSETYNTQGNAEIMDIGWIIPNEVRKEAYIVEVEVPNGTLRYNVIKPLNAADGYQRVMWRNEYGGISFFDFTGQRSITDNIDVETYEKSIFDFYNTDYDKETSEIEKIYSNKVTKTWKMKSHILENGGQYIFNSMMHSKMIWTELDGKDVVLIPKSFEVTEDQNYDNLFTVSVSFNFSDNITF